jgi:plastocyanin
MRSQILVFAALTGACGLLLACGDDGDQAANRPSTTQKQSTERAKQRTTRKRTARSKQSAKGSASGESEGGTESKGEPDQTGASQKTTAEQPKQKSSSSPSHRGKKRRPTAKKQAPKQMTVTIKDFKFTPQRVVVARGGSVYWVNKEAKVNHTATKKSGPGAAPNSPNIGWGGDTYTDFFKVTGTIQYICTYHPRMKGYITVR